ncbi:hypothetical protein LTR37_021017 [Vermiconidia calcicola]|uniref:Uncharacterized protein n=1 Tax=Vermiconidia calcicola TaxID=1690605 RepID=A0ACC3M9R3_9PEZI|nr:hypothetical protein LTR37_021017 [Vermiconidia calcicola]
MAGSYDMAKGASTAVRTGSPETSQETYLDPGDWDALDAVAKEGFTANDQRDMQRMGKKQEFRRNFRFLTTVGFTCTWEILMTSNTQALTAGGSAALFLVALLVLYWPDIHRIVLGGDELHGAHCGWSVPLGIGVCASELAETAQLSLR